MDSVDEAEQCLGSDLLSWVEYPVTGQSCYVYPQFLKDQSGWHPIQSDIFPNAGCFQGVILGNIPLDEIAMKYTPIVIAKINKNYLDHNDYYEPSVELSSKYRFRINPLLSKGTSDLEFTSFSKHPYSHELIQIVSLENNDVSFLHPIKEPLPIKSPIENLICRAILIERTDSFNNPVYYGPFIYSTHSTDNNTITISAIESNDYHVLKIDAEQIKDVLPLRDKNHTIRARFIDETCLKPLFDSGNSLDWLPDTKLLEYISRIINESTSITKLSKSQKKNLKQTLRNYADPTNQINFDASRIDRLESIISNVEKFPKIPKNILDTVASSIKPEDIKRILAQTDSPIKQALVNSSTIQDQMRAQVEQEKQKLQASLDALENQQKEARYTLARINNDISTAQVEKKRAEEQFGEIQDQALSKKNDELKKLDQEIEQRKKELNNAAKDYENLSNKEKDLETNINKTIDSINDDVAMSSKLLESKLLNKVVDAVSGTKVKDTIPQTINLLRRTDQDESSLSDNDVITSLSDAIIETAGRDYTRNDIINFMICLTQGYITTFAGQPGTGKTSLCKILAKALGLYSEDDPVSRFTEIDVENGWTSYKDYIGYYSPLTTTYEKVNSTVFDAMHALANEDDQLNAIPPYIFLLDEANLSPIEHYWSPFLHACDSFASHGVSIPLGGNSTWHLPSYVRFLATVNFDHTTELLSQRFLDRSWVITLDPARLDFSENLYDAHSDNKPFHTYSYNRLTKIFGYNDTNKIPSDIYLQFSNLLNICNSNHFPVSPRSQLMMKDYISTAVQLMDIDSKDTGLAPLDYAFSQKVLPMISGANEHIEKLLEELKDNCSSMEITQKRLSRMIDYGQNDGFYQYFV